ncbi:alginate lyase family protein [uncultured Polaribacter sp.]|uniref:alginate lyase family protein n=1 Tax=uncultured Polaribacter sp. TaxID=174711 RepID=UPI00263195DF|nr:alginate lyase family protein [uncultured Polaribacter sp.]
MKNKVSFFKRIVFLLLVGLGGVLFAQKSHKKSYLIEYEALENQKLLIKDGDKDAVKNYNQLIQKADSLFTLGSFSVVHKTGVPPSKSKHDYMSIGPYWWPNPETANGLPYIRKDGEKNPETRNNFTDYVEKDNFLVAIKTLTKAYYFSDQKKYADKVLELINAWFLEDATKMNPNLNYGQYIPGISEGRCFGIIEFGGITEVIKFLELAKDRNLLAKKTEKGMFNWFTAYSTWLQNSKLGKEEATRKNNHATHYDLQLLNILIYLNKTAQVKEYLSTITKARIFSQIEPDGSQPLELARTKSFSYSVMNLHAFLELAILGKKVDVNLWDEESKDGRSIKKGYQYMLPYVTKEKEWEFQQIKDRKNSEEKLIRDLQYISNNFKEYSFDKILQQIHQKK